MAPTWAGPGLFISITNFFSYHSRKNKLESRFVVACHSFALLLKKYWRSRSFKLYLLPFWKVIVEPLKNIYRGLWGLTMNKFRLPSTGSKLNWLLFFSLGKLKTALTILESTWFELTRSIISWLLRLIILSHSCIPSLIVFRKFLLRMLLDSWIACVCIDCTVVWEESRSASSCFPDNCFWFLVASASFTVTGSNLLPYHNESLAFHVFLLIFQLLLKILILAIFLVFLNHHDYELNT